MFAHGWVVVLVRFYSPAILEGDGAIKRFLQILRFVRFTQETRRWARSASTDGHSAVRLVDAH